MLVLIGMVGTARLFREEYLGPVPAVMKGFVPITAGGPQQGSAPPLANRPRSSVRPQIALVSPAERTQRLQRVQAGTATAQPAPPAGNPSLAENSPQPVASAQRIYAPLIAGGVPVADSAPAAGQPDTTGGGEGSAADNSAAGSESTPLTLDPGPPAIPERIDIPVIGLEAPVVEVPAVPVWVDGQSLQQWSAPNTFAAGWHATSALLGQPGNTVINGHHNVYGSVFGRLHDLQPGDQIMLWSQGRVFFYEVDQVLLLEERFAGLDNRQENARWILPSDDERLTLVTCWPPESNTHRLIVLARPLLP